MNVIAEFGIAGACVITAVAREIMSVMINAMNVVIKILNKRILEITKIKMMEFVCIKVEILEYSPEQDSEQVKTKNIIIIQSVVIDWLNLLKYGGGDSIYEKGESEGVMDAIEAKNAFVDGILIDYDEECMDPIELDRFDYES
ncbi:MAG: hypothetical protein EZS28_036912 [Streblomastix strix]|uniref:Uncharacterized protein n=1 Tax=Streblomastix strix TaxID=222440 RepID=A0A5J4UCC1_9EUKA|nr:MAG: hypothetical protein EZS28_036912 [Streblomastix strix]